MIYIGIDVGKKGGVAIIFKDGVCAYPWDDERFIQTMDIAAHMDDNCIACDGKKHNCPLRDVLKDLPVMGITNYYVACWQEEDK